MIQERQFQQKNMKGIYVLIIAINEGVRIDVGALGTVKFQRGLYAYVGSAQNALEKRVERHLKKMKRKFWHIDYLLDNVGARVLKIFWKEAGKLEECQISTRIKERGIPISGFGSSDCKCESHLFRIEDSDFLREFMRQISVESIRKAVYSACATKRIEMLARTRTTAPWQPLSEDDKPLLRPIEPQPYNQCRKRRSH